MKNKLDVEVRITKPSDQYFRMCESITSFGNYIGKLKYKEKWKEHLYPSSEKLRIWTCPKTSEGKLGIEVTPFAWSELQRHKQIQAIDKFQDDDSAKYLFNAVVLTVNAVIETEDHRLVFHKKKGGAKHGSIHTFGGYVESRDVNGNITLAIERELGENSELGLRKDEFSVGEFFGTPEGMPAILWDYGTAAIYALVKTKLDAREIETRFKKISGEETLNRDCFTIDVANVNKLLKEENLHPQTKLVVPVIADLYA